MTENVVSLAGRRARRKRGFTPVYQDPRAFERVAFREPTLWQRAQAEHPMLFDLLAAAIAIAAFILIWIEAPQ